MNRLLIVVLALTMGACSSVNANLLQRGAKAPSEETVRAYLRQDDEAGARAWLLKLRMPDAYIDEAIILAKQEVAKERARCAGLSNCAASAAKESK